MIRSPISSPAVPSKTPPPSFTPPAPKHSPPGLRSPTWRWLHNLIYQRHVSIRCAVRVSIGNNLTVSAEVVGPVDRHDVNGLFLTVGPDFHHPHNPSHASTPKREKGRETTASAPAPQSPGSPSDGATLDQMLPASPDESEDKERRAMRWRPALTSTLGASLEVAKQGEVGLEQAFAPIHIVRLQALDVDLR
jgi:hypothetical protein